MPSFENPIDNQTFKVRAGFPGIVALDNDLIRAQSCNVKGEQPIEAVDDIDGSIDRTRYKMGQFKAGGDVAFTLDKGVALLGSGLPDLTAPGGNLSVFGKLWKACTRRTDEGKFAEFRDLLVHYHSGFTYVYENMVVDKMALKIDNGGTLDCTASFKGRGRRPAGPSDTLPNLSTSNAEAPLRVIAYNDVQIAIENINGSTVDQNEFKLVKSFDVTVDNQSEEVYVIAGQLAPYDILPKKRVINGSVTFFGKPEGLADQAKFREDDLGVNIPYINLSLQARIGQNFFTIVKFFGVIFQLDSTTLTNGVLETTMQFQALGTDADRFLAISDFGGTSYTAADQPHPFPL
jgi:hypothetical protein